MIQSREVITASLEHALVANRVLAALASGNFASQDAQDAVEDGARFLNSMIAGWQATNSRSVSPDSYGAALAYGEGVKAFQLVAFPRDENAEPVIYLRSLIEIASALGKNAQVDQTAVEKFTSFFRTVRDLAFASGEPQIERVL